MAELQSQTSRSRSLWPFYREVDGLEFSNPPIARERFDHILAEGLSHYTAPPDLWHNIAMMEYIKEHPLANQLPESYPFWVLFLIAMYYRLNPDHLDDFVRGRGVIYELMKNPGSVQSDKWGTGPFREFCQYADRFGASAGSSLQVLRVEHLLALASIVRESTFDGQL